MQSAQEAHSKKWRPFEEARQYVRSLGLKSQKEWNEYIRSGKLPDDIPKTPWVVYDKELQLGEWRGLADWLGVEVSKWNPLNCSLTIICIAGIVSVAILLR